MMYLLHLVVYFAIFAIVALSLNLSVGYCGILTMVHAAYFAVGGYIYALTTMRLDLGFLPASAFAMLVCGVLSLAISIPAWRFRGDFIMLVTLAVPETETETSVPKAGLKSWSLGCRGNEKLVRLLGIESACVIV